MNTLRSLPSRPPSRSLRGAAAILGAVLVAAPLATASAAGVDHGASERDEAPLDLRLALANEQRRLALRLASLLGVGMDRSARGLVDAHDSWQSTVTFGFLTEGWSSASDDEADEGSHGSDHPTDDETDEDEAEVQAPTGWERTEDRLEYVTETNDPLAGL